MLESPGHGLRSQVGLLLLDVRAQRSPLDLSLGPGRHLYVVYSRSGSTGLGLARGYILRG